MARRQVLFQSAAREKILRGATALTDALRVTFGPKSKSVLMGKRWGSPIVCNDGVTVAKEFDLKDPEENLGAQVIVEEAKATETAVDVVQGMQFDRGYLSPYFVSDPERMECVLQDPVILIHEKRIGVMKDMRPILEYVAKEGAPCSSSPRILRATRSRRSSSTSSAARSSAWP